MRRTNNLLPGKEILMESSAKKQDLKRILLYAGITFLLTYGYCFLILYPVINGESLSGVPSLTAQLMTAAVMFFPSIGVLLTRLITKEGFRDSWLKPNLKWNIKTYLLAWFGPGVLTIIGSALYFLLFKGSFDTNCGYMVTMLEAAGTTADMIPIPISLLMVIQGLQGLLLAPAMNFVTCFGEEWGWRGYLLPKLSKQLPMIPTLLISGVIWGLWHAPLTAVGHNYGLGYAGFPFAGIAMMCLFCVVLGVFFSYVTMKTGSCIPAILAHGAINGFAATGMYFTKDGGDPFVGPAPMGIIGMIPFIIVAVLMVIRLHKMQTK